MPLSNAPTDLADTPLAIAPMLERFAGVRTIAVLRGGALGDVLFAVPAIEALAVAYPDAAITVLGSPLHRRLLPGRLRAEVTVEELPAARGVFAGEEDEEALENFFARFRGRFDLAVQLHGGGRNSNPFLLRLEAPHTVGTATDDAARLERTLHYTYFQHEVARSLEVVGLAGAAPVALEPRLFATADDRERASEAVGTFDGRTVVVHPGATDLRRRWSAAKFAAVADRLVESGCRVLVVGDDGDVELAEAVLRQARPSPLLASLAGRLDIGALCGLLSTVDLFVGNDSGPRHLAQALGAPTASIYWCGNVVNAGPIGRARHRVQISFTIACPTCGVDATAADSRRCEHDDSFVDQVGVEAVVADAFSLMATNPPPRGR